MIQLENISLSYSGIPLLENVSFSIGKKERAGLVGRNGAGKSTLFRMLMGAEKPDSGTINIAKGYRIGWLQQHINFTMPTVLEETALGLPLDEQCDLYKAEKMLIGLGFSEIDFDKSPKDLSGGYQLRVNLAKLLLSEPDCLLLDEPTNYLDILSMRFLSKVLARWQGELIIISHDREFMDSITTHTLGIVRKRVKKIAGSSINFYTKIAEEEEIHEKTKINLDKKKAHLQSFIDRFGAKATKAKQAGARKKALDKIPALEALKSLYNLDFEFRIKPLPGEKLGEIKNVSFGYSEKNIIKEFSLLLEAGDRIAIIGKNGYGKSTLLKLIAKELKPKSGSISYAEQIEIGYFGQTNIERLHKDLTIEEEIKLANPKLSYSDVKAIAGQMLFSGELSEKKISVLSGGEKSRVLLGKIISNPCNFLLLDEPTHHLDVESIEALIDALNDFPETFMIVTHSELILKRLELDKLIICHEDRQEIFLGNYSEFLEKQGWEEEKPQKKSPKPKEIKETHKPTISDKEIQILENKIEKLEKEQTLDFELLAKACEKNETSKIQELTKKTENRQKLIDELFHQL
jgi:ATP-binding cassette subfamily F protein 3